MDESSTTLEIAALRSDLESAIRRKVIEVVRVILEEELEVALGCGPYERTGKRLGYRNGSAERELTTQHGLLKIDVPRGRVFEDDGGTSEFRSQIVPKYARRTQQVDEAILSAYLAGANTRRIRKALEPLLGSQHLSKSAVSRVVGHLKGLFEEWDHRDLTDERYQILILDAIHLKVRLARRVVSAPVLVVMGVAGSVRHVVALRLAASEAASCWNDLLVDLQRRGLDAPKLLIADGHAGLAKALAAWPDAAIQRCTVHKRRNLINHCPAHAQKEVARDYDAIVYAVDLAEALTAYKAFVAKWSRLCPSVVRSLEEGGHQLLTFYEFPQPLWRSIRSTNSIENLNREFRRRTKTQASFSTEAAAVTLLYGLLASGQIPTRRIDGHYSLPDAFGARTTEAA